TEPGRESASSWSIPRPPDPVRPFKINPGLRSGQTGSSICRHGNTRLSRPRRTAQRLRRLAEGADESAPHPLGIAEAGDLGDALDRLAGGLHALARHLDAQPLDRL